MRREMAEISFACPHCKQHLDAPPEMAGDQLACPTCRKPIQVPTVEPVKLSPQRGPLAGRLVAGIVGGLILAILGANISELLFADPMAKEPGKTVTDISALLFLGLWAVSIGMGIKARSAAKAWRRLLITNGCLSFALPLAGFVMAGRAAYLYEAKGAHHAAAASAGAGGVMAIFLGILGFFLGAIFLTIGLLVGRKQKDAK